MSDTQLKQIDINPGFFKNSTDYASENYWVDGDKIRFRNGRAEKVGGFVKESTFIGRTNKLHSWMDLTYSQYLVSGTESHVQILNGGQVYDVTPYRTTASLTNPISVSSGSNIITITATSHDLKVGDYIFVISQASSVGSINLQGFEYVVKTVPTTDTFTIQFTSNASSNSTGGGAVSIGFYIPTAGTSSTSLTGYGGGTWGTPGEAGGGYGMPRDSSTIDNILRLWSFDNWGEDLIGCYTKGGIYQWDATTGLGTRLQLISGAPTENLFTLIAQPSRHLVAFGTQESVGGVFDPMTIRWADQETLTDWTITPTNTAGEYRLPLGNKIVAAIQTRSEILVLTDTTVYSMRYVGGTDIFQFQILANNISSTSQNCGTDINGIVYWQGLDGFYMYNGSVQRLPCSLSLFLFDQDGDGRLNKDQKDKVICGTNKEFNEIIWFYPVYSSNENSRYVIYNYLENLWYDGTWERTSWLDSSVFNRPYATTSTGTLYVHEVGKDADSVAMPAYIKSGSMDIEDGQKLMFVDKFIPDFRLIPNRNAQVTLTFKKYPNSVTSSIKGPFTFNNSTDKISLRGRGRQVSIEYSVDTTGSDFMIGAPRFSIQPDGER